MIPQPPIPILIPSSWDSDSDSGVYQILWFRFQRSMIPIPTPIPGFPKNFDSDSDSRVTGFWFRFQGFPNSMIPIPILIPVIHDSDSNSDSRDSHIFWFRFHVSDFDSNFDSNFDSTVVLTIPSSIQWRFGNITGLVLYNYHDHDLSLAFTSIEDNWPNSNETLYNSHRKTDPC